MGSAQTNSVFPNFNLGARIAICGQISQYNLETPEVGLRLLSSFIGKRLSMRGFLVHDYVGQHAQALTEIAKWLNSGKLHYRETITRGLENAPTAFISILNEGDLGKQLVQVAEVDF